jgi:hypothetical protein
MSYGLEIRGLIADRGKRFISSPQRPDRLWGEPNLLYNGYWEFFPGVKRLRHEADDSLEYSAEVKKWHSCTFTSPFAFMA